MNGISHAGINSITNKTNPPTPSRQTIGKSGSFWLPPKSVNTFEHNLGKHANQNNKLPKEGQLGKKTNTVAQKVPHRDIPSSPKASIQLKPFRSTQLTTNTSIQNQKNHLQNPKHPSGNTILHNKPNGTPVKSHLVERINYHIPSKTHQQNKTSNPTKPEYSSILTDPDTERKDGSKGKNHRGTKNALKAMIMDNFCVTSEPKPSNPIQRQTARIPTYVSLAKLINDQVQPRLNYISKFGKKVIRFALDLPTGSLGVRIEKKNDALSLAFICPDQITKNSAKHFSSSLLLLDQNLQIGIFDSYQDMDSSKTVTF